MEGGADELKDEDGKDEEDSKDDEDGDDETVVIEVTGEVFL